ncbi:hypothetical protein CWE12_04250 [Aliidiomarina sedimenti]|uniref:VWFA domain-containing protein n=1 Tax=Aliidiomarina sedimenti TaxID=1933879 RepID=A0ABY0C308_9GAMM|nr:tetratricopeptide repeat protein [Aliidiomarina sedimenti]RUO32197.1 hypothetical protein CWE12_04250 [Aliidiomarina sedimenti]
MEDFHFLRPGWLFSLIGLVVLLPWLWSQLGRNSGWQKVIASHLQPVLLAPSGASSRRTAPLLILCAAWVIASLSLAGPAWEKAPAPVYQTERGTVIVMDMSMNTRATDISPDRLTRLRFKALDLVAELDDAQIGLIAYAGDAFAISPLTHDHGNIQAMVPAMSPEIMPVAGNYPLLAMREADRMLRDAGFEQGEIYWFAAGMEQDDLQELTQFFRSRQHRVSTIIAGDDESTPIRLSSGEMLRDTLGRITMARLNPSFFERVSVATGGVSVRVEAGNSDIQRVIDQGPLNERAGEQADDMSSDQWIDRGPYLAWLLLPLALLMARRGALLCLLCLPFAAFHSPVSAQQQTQNEVLDNAFQNRQQRADEAYQQGDYEKAASLFPDPMMRANALYRAGDYAAALSAYSETGDSAERWYNSGNSLAQLGQFDEAIEAYQRALEKRPGWSEAEQNKAKVEQMREQQQQNESQGEQQSETDEREQSDQNEQGQSDDQQQSDEPETGSDSAPSPPSDEQPENQAEEETESEQSEQQQESESEPGDESELDGQPPATAQDQERLNEDDLSDEERAELEQLLRRMESDPAILLRNRMRLEAERRQYNQPPRGARQP